MVHSTVNNTHSDWESQEETYARKHYKSYRYEPNSGSQNLKRCEVILHCYIKTSRGSDRSEKIESHRHCFHQLRCLIHSVWYLLLSRWVCILSRRTWSSPTGKYWICVRMGMGVSCGVGMCAFVICQKWGLSYEYRQGYICRDVRVQLLSWFQCFLLQKFVFSFIFSPKFCIVFQCF